MNKTINNHSKRLIIAAPIIAGVVIYSSYFLSHNVALWISEKKIPRGGFTTIVFWFIFEGFGINIPFLVIATIVRDLIRKGAGNPEIYIKTGFMLMPVSIATVYWIIKYTDPYTFVFLLFINGLLLVCGLLLGASVYRISKYSDTETGAGWK
jgi:hypothetical protein